MKKWRTNSTSLDINGAFENFKCSILHEFIMMGFWDFMKSMRTMLLIYIMYQQDMDKQNEIY